MIIKKTDKILIIAPHPDDEVIACGGFISRYASQIDVLCINSSGVKYNWDTLSAEEIAEVRCNEFKDTMKKAGVKKYSITKIWGVPPMIDKIKGNFDKYASEFNFKEYDYILVPHKQDEHIEHRYVGNVLLKQILRKTGYKPSLKIVRYELWSTINKPNYYEDITNFVQNKMDLIKNYESRKNSHYGERILGLNKYRTLIPYFNNPEKYVEAFYVESVQDYLGISIYKKILTGFFSVKNQYSHNKKYKVITILGLKIKLKTNGD